MAGLDQIMAGGAGWMIAIAVGVIGGAIFISIAAGVMGIQGVTASGALLYGIVMTLVGWGGPVFLVSLGVSQPSLVWVITPLLLFLVVKGLFGTTSGKALGAVILSYGMYMLAAALLGVLTP